MKIFDIASVSLEQLSSDELADMVDSELNIIAQPDEQAIELARQAEATEGGMIVVVDPDRKPIGVLDPQLVLHLYQENKGIQERRLVDALDNLSSDPDELARHFHHEWLNYARVSPYWCDKGKHRSIYKNCPYHP